MNVRVRLSIYLTICLSCLSSSQEMEPPSHLISVLQHDVKKNNNNNNNKKQKKKKNEIYICMCLILRKRERVWEREYEIDIG